MKLAAKLVLLFLTCLALVVGVFSYLSVRQAKELALAEHERHAADLAATLQSSLRGSPRSSTDVQRVLSGWSREVRHVRVRLVHPHGEGHTGLRPAVPSHWIVTATETTTFLHPNAAGQPTIYTYVPLDDAAGSSLEVAAPEAFWSDRLTRSLRDSAIALLAVSAATSVVILLGGLWMVGRPLEVLVDKVRRVGQGDLSDPIALSGGDELGRLGEAVNEMCERLEHQHERIESETRRRIAAVEQLRHADRLRTVGRLAAGLAHEIGTPLNVVSGRAELIAGGKLSDADIRASALTIKTQSQRIAGIVQELLNFARRTSPQRQRCDLNELLRETIELVRPIARKHGARIEWTAPPEPSMAHVDASQFQQVLTNLIVNAVQASAETGAPTQEADSRIRVGDARHGECRVGDAGHGEPRIDVEIALAPRDALAPPSDVEAPAGDCWRITVQDNGMGMSPEVLESVFEPFFTTKDVGEGTGLGLSIAWGIVREHGGWIDVHSQLGIGSRFDLFLQKSSSQ